MRGDLLWIAQDPWDVGIFYGKVKSETPSFSKSGSLSLFGILFSFIHLFFQ